MSLPYYEDTQYVIRLPLKNLKKIGNGWRCSCPFCGEGSSPWKTRCNIIMPTVNHNHVTVYCFNCGMDTNVKNLVRKTAPYLLSEYEETERAYFLSNLQNGTTRQKIQDKTPKININIFSKTQTNKHDFLQYQFILNEKYFKPAIDFEVARTFCKKRNILKYIDEFKYCTHTNIACGGMVIFPFKTAFGDLIYGFQGRHPLEKRFNTFSNNEGFKVHGLFEIDHKKPIVVCESIIDRYAIHNSIAMVGADLSPFVMNNVLNKCSLIFACDNDTTGLKKAEKYCELGYRVLVWPDSITTKDFNDLSCVGWTNEQITNMIYENSFSGLQLQTRLTFKKMKKKR